MSNDSSQPDHGPSNTTTILFMVVLSLVCALILSILASALETPKEIAKDLDRSKQMMIAAKILDYNGHFIIQDASGKNIPAHEVGDGILEPGAGENPASNTQLLAVYKKRLIPKLLDKNGNLISFEDAHLTEDQYIAEYKKSGYYKAPLKLLYEISPNPTAAAQGESKSGAQLKPIGYVIPVNGFGLWDAIYGYLAIQPDGNTVIGITWYDQKETPGLGANISEQPWQSLFPGKTIFQGGSSGVFDPALAPLGLIVVKGRVSDVLGDSPKAKSAVDGMAGATLTGNGVTDAYRDVLSAYRPFFVRLQKEHSEPQPQKK